jgi:hypothetical protein
MKNVSEETRQHFFEFSKDLFGKNVRLISIFLCSIFKYFLTPTVVCIDCFSSIQFHSKCITTCNDFKQKVLESQIKPSIIVVSKVKEYMNAIDEPVSIRNINGILMIIPISKHNDIARFKYFKKQYSPVSLSNLPVIIKPNVDHYESEIEPPQIKIEAVHSILQSVYNNSEDGSEANVNESSSNNLEISDASSDEINVVLCKLEPNIEIESEAIEGDEVEILENVQQVQAGFKCTLSNKRMKKN